MESFGTEVFGNVGIPPSSSSCLICHKRIKIGTIAAQDSGKDDVVEVLKKIASILQVSLSIYDVVDLAKIPVQLLCSSCNETIVDAIQLQEAMRTLQNQLKKLSMMIKRDIIQSFHIDSIQKGEEVTGDEICQVELIRKTFAQCWATCEVTLQPCEFPPGFWLTSSVDSSNDCDYSSSFRALSDEESSEFEGEPGESDTHWDPSIVKSESIGIWEESFPLQSQEIAESEIKQELEINQVMTYNSNIRKTTRRKPAQCSKCGRIFTRESSLRDHLRRKKACSKDKFYSYRKGQQIVALPKAKSNFSDPPNPATIPNQSLHAQIEGPSQMENPINNPVFYLVLPPVMTTPIMTTPVAGNTDTQAMISSNKLEKSDSSNQSEAMTLMDSKVSIKSSLLSRKISNSSTNSAHVSTRLVLPAGSTSSQVLNFMPKQKIRKKSKTARRPVKCKRCGKLFTKFTSLKGHLQKKNPCINLNLNLDNGPLAPAILTEDESHFQGELHLSEYKNEIVYEDENDDEESEQHEHFKAGELSVTSNHVLPNFEYDAPGVEKSTGYQLAVPHPVIASEIKVSTSQTPSLIESLLVNTVSKRSSFHTRDPLDIQSNETISSKTNSDRFDQTQPSPLRFDCPTCHRKFTTYSHLSSHIRLSHQDIQCKSCGEIFSSHGNLMLHRREVHGYVNTNKRVRESIFKCELCHKSYTKKSNLGAHIMQKHHGIPKVLPCIICNQIFPTKHQLHKHIAALHGQHCECKFCGETLLEDKLPQHLELHNGNPDFPCRLCPVRLPTERAFMFHQSKSHNQGSTNSLSSQPL